MVERLKLRSHHLQASKLWVLPPPSWVQGASAASESGRPIRITAILDPSEKVIPKNYLVADVELITASISQRSGSTHLDNGDSFNLLVRGSQLEKFAHYLATKEGKGCEAVIQAPQKCLREPHKYFFLGDPRNMVLPAIESIDSAEPQDNHCNFSPGGGKKNLKTTLRRQPSVVNHSASHLTTKTATKQGITSNCPHIGVP